MCVFPFCFVNCRAPVPLQLFPQSGSLGPTLGPFGAQPPRPALRAAPTFLLVGGLSLSRPPTPGQAEGALPGEAGAAGVEGSRDSALLLPPLFPL